MLALSQLSLSLHGPTAVPTRAPAPAMAFKTDVPRPDLQSGLDFNKDRLDSLEAALVHHSGKLNLYSE